MSKVKSTYYCQNCGAQYAKWVGKCNSCNEWNTITEEIVQKADKRTEHIFSAQSQKNIKPISIDSIEKAQHYRISISDKELERVLGGGIVPGSVVLFGGEPGIGKSTLMLQLALQLKQLKILYVSGEESEQQIKMRAERMSFKNEQCYILPETSTQHIFQHINELEPQLVIIDSIQTLHTAYVESAPGSVTQVRECTAELIRYAKSTNTPIFLIGHITKEGTLAGPKVLEHMVDTVLQFEGDRHYSYRLLRTTKNRFGSTNELGIYEMVSGGLREIINPSEILITQRDTATTGVAISATIEGMRPMLLETQALVSSAAYGTPQRSATGFDLRRMNMILAVLEKRCGFRLGIKDVFVNIAGGIKIEDPALDLALACAILSSNEDLPIPPDVCFAAEVGLTGELRPVTRIEQRITEAEKLGFKKIYICQYNMKGMDSKAFGLQVMPFIKIEEVFQSLFA
jgi:DNA repair protein RadA/Sms